jgi:SHS2 domain-containing protein
MMAEWREIEDHTADSGIEVWADNLRELLIEASSAFYELSTPDFADVGSNIKHEVIIEEEDEEFLLHSFLNECLYLLDSKHFIANTWLKPKIIATPDSYVLSCTLQGGTFVRGQHESGMEVKAITWHQLVCMKADEGWYAMVIFDI